MGGGVDAVDVAVVAIAVVAAADDVVVDFVDAGNDADVVDAAAAADAVDDAGVAGDADVVADVDVGVAAVVVDDDVVAAVVVDDVAVVVVAGGDDDGDGDRHFRLILPTPHDDHPQFASLQQFDFGHISSYQRHDLQPRMKLCCHHHCYFRLLV